MADIVTTEKRSLMMAGIKGKNTKPEKLIRSALHARGYRFRIHVSSLPGKPDIVLPRYRAIILVNGCFWHGHECHLFKWPSTRQEFWQNKISGNRTADTKTREFLMRQGWRILIIWECAIKGRYRLNFPQIIDKMANWIESDKVVYEIKGKT